MRRWWLGLVGGVLAWAVAGPPAVCAQEAPTAAAPVTAGDPGVFAILDEAATPADAAAALRAAGYDAPRVATALRAGRPYAAVPSGLLPITLQAGERTTQCELLVPPGYTPARRWPAVVALHGLGGNARQMIRILGPAAEQAGVLLICPTATAPRDVAPFIREAVWRVASRHQWWAYEEVSFPLAALRAAKRRLNVDEDRVCITGYSMGGFGSWNISLRHWDLFAGAAPMAGGLAPREGVQGRDTGLRRLLANGTHLPFFVVHGADDPLVPVDFSRWNTAALTALGATVTYHEVPGAGHILPRAAFEELVPQLMRFLTDARRAPVTRTVHHVALAPSHGLAGWVRVDASTGPTDVQVRFPADPDANPVEVQATGLTALTLFVPDAWAPAAATPQVRVNGRLVTAAAADPLEALADAWMAREDRTRAYRQRWSLRVPAPDSADNDF